MRRPAKSTHAAEDGRHLVTPGDRVIGRELTTIHSEQIPLPDPGALTHLQFRRFAGCPICNVHLRSVARRHDELVAAGIREVAVFHSPVEAMLPHQGALPFAAIADPDRELYHAFGVESSPRAVAHPRAWSSVFTPQAWSFVLRSVRTGRHIGPGDGESVLGLPADFLIASDGRVQAVKYGRDANDQWSIDELLALAREAG